MNFFSDWKKEGKDIPINEDIVKETKVTSFGSLHIFNWMHYEILESCSLLDKTSQLTQEKRLPEKLLTYVPAGDKNLCKGTL